MSSDIARITHRSNLNKDDVRNALESDKGCHINLVSWREENMAIQGATSAIRRIHVKYELDNEIFEKSYVVKMNLGSTIKSTEKKTQMYFQKEREFYNNLAPMMNCVLEKVSRELRVPRCFLCVTNVGEELTFMEDLSTLGFESSRCVANGSLDLPHGLLVMKELAKFHASSMIIEKSIINDNIENRFSIIKPNWFEEYPHRNFFEKCWSKQIAVVADVVRKEGNSHRRHLEWLESLKGNVIDALLDLATPSHPKFSVLIHNDCWINNILFKYNKEGKPIAAMLVDLQMTTKASLVIDMIFFMFISMQWRDRQEHWRELLVMYYDTFCSIVNDAEQGMDFSLQEFEEEFQSKIGYGVIFSLILSPKKFSKEVEIVPTPMTEEEQESYPEKYETYALKVLQEPHFGHMLKEMYLGSLGQLHVIGAT